MLLDIFLSPTLLPMFLAGLVSASCLFLTVLEMIHHEETPGVLAVAAIPIPWIALGWLLLHRDDTPKHKKILVAWLVSFVISMLAMTVHLLLDA